MQIPDPYPVGTAEVEPALLHGVLRFGERAESPSTCWTAWFNDMQARAMASRVCVDKHARLFNQAGKTNERLFAAVARREVLSYGREEGIYPLE